MEIINFAIIEDTEDIRLNLYEYLQAVQGFHCMVCCSSVEEFIAFDDYDVLPDIILSDISLPGKNGIEGIPLIKSKFPESDIVMFTVFNENEKVFSALCAGASGYILKGAALSEIEAAMRSIVSGGSYMSPAIARKVVNFFTPVTLRTENLTDRETAIVKALAEGLSYKLIADRLSISIDAIRYHIKNIYKKLQVNSKAEVIRKVLRGEI